MTRKILALGIVFAICLFFYDRAASAAMKNDEFEMLCMTGSAVDVYRAIKDGADVNARDRNGSGPLTSAAYNDENRLEIVALLLVAGAVPNELDLIIFDDSRRAKARSLMVDFSNNSTNARDQASLIWRKIENADERERRSKRLNAAVENVTASLGQDGSKERFAQLKQAAEAGAPMSQHMLAAMYEAGDGVEKSITEAVKWYEKAASQGQTMSMNRLGEIYRDGIGGVTRNKSKAMDLFGRAAKGGYVVAGANLADMVAAEFLDLCTKGNDWQVKNAINNGVDVNLRDGRGQTPLMWAVTAGKTDNANLLLNMGADASVRDNSGKTVLEYAAARGDRDTTLYRRLQLRALQVQNNSVDVESLFSQGTKAYNAKNYKNAFRLFSQAAEAGHVWSVIRLGEMYFNGEGVEKDDSLAFYWMKIGAGEDHARTQYNLAYLYETGQGVNKDTNEALNWYRKAALNGFEEANDSIVALGGTPVNPTTPK